MRRRPNRVAVLGSAAVLVVLVLVAGGIVLVARPFTPTAALLVPQFVEEASAAGVDELVIKLREMYGLTIVMITHDLDLLWQVADRVAVLGEGKVRGVGSMSELEHLDHPAIREYFDGPRGRAAQQQEEKRERRPSNPK